VSDIGGLTLLFAIRYSPVLNNSRQSHRSDELIIGFDRDPPTSFYPHQMSRVRDEPAQAKLVAGFRTKRRPRPKKADCLSSTPAGRGAKAVVSRPLCNGQTRARIAAHFAVSVGRPRDAVGRVSNSNLDSADM
jgi:hypothetical protein